MLDLTKIRIENGSQAAGFEELCVQLAEAMCQEPLHDLRRVNGAGGDGGVEAVAISASGYQIGIQCKYFRDNLSTSQWAQIKASVKQAMQHHSTLSKYFICVPRDRTPGQLITWDQLVADWKRTYPDLVVTWFGKFELTELLLQPQWRYLATYWLDAPDYSSVWLASKIQLAIQQLDGRFTPRLHNNTQAGKDLATLLALPEALNEYRDGCLDLAINTRELEKILSISREDEPNILTAANTNVKMAVHDVLSNIVDGQLLTQRTKFGSAVDSLLLTVSELVDSVNEQENLSRERDSQISQNVREQFSSIRRSVRDVRSSARQVQQAFTTYQKAMLSPLWLLVGEAGIGKSHLMAIAAQKSLEQRAGAVLLLGEQFLEVRPLTQQIPDLLGWKHSSTDLLACLRAQYEVSGRPSLVLVDAINESHDRKLWHSHLHQLLEEVKQYPGVHLVLSCRQDWLSACVPRTLRETALMIEHNGYDLDFEEVVNAYFDGYNVSTDVFPSFAPEFRNPLFLKTVCETYQDRKLPDEPLSFVAVLDAWEERIGEKIEQAIDCSRLLVKEAIRRIVEKLATLHATSIPAVDAEKICLELFPTSAASHSLFKRLQSFGAIREFVRDDVTLVRLQYERFYDVKVARVELQKFEDVASWLRFWREDILPHLGSWDVEIASEARLFAYALLLPEIFDIELVECPFPESDETEFLYVDKLWDTWLEALAWRKIPSTHVRIQDLFNTWQQTGEPPISVFNRILSFVAIEGHPLNADFLHDVLWSKTLIKRELFWTIPLGYEDLSQKREELGRFVRWCEMAGNRCSDEQSRLAAIVLLWLTSSTNQENRDRATDSAIRLLRGRSTPVFHLVDLFWEVNDPYVKERLIAVLAGLMPTLELDDLRTLGNVVCSLFFGSGQPPLNLMQREYARFIAEYCIHHGVLSDELLERVRPPYHTVAPTIWSDAQAKRFEDDPVFAIIRSSLQPEDSKHMYGDFGRYVMQSAVQKFTDPIAVRPDADGIRERYPHENAHDAMRFIMQKIVELGWLDEKEELGRFERSIQFDGRQRPPMERISKKFQWIGLYEYLGYLSDHRKLRLFSNELVDFSSLSELMLRNYDPALAFFSDKANKDTLLTRMEAKTHNPIPKMGGETDRAAWIKSDFEDFAPYLHVEIAGEPRLVLSSHLSFDEQLPFGIAKKNVQHAAQWVNLYSFIVPEENAMSLGASLSTRTFWGHGVGVPKAYSRWITEYPWHPMLDEVEQECSSGHWFLSEEDGLFHGTVCTIGAEERPLILPSPGICREMSKSRLGILSAPEQLTTGDFHIKAQNGQVIFWGSVGNNSVVAASYQEFMGWLRDRKWNLMCCFLSARSINQNDNLLAESHQSAVVILRPFEDPIRILAQRHDWKRGETQN